MEWRDIESAPVGELIIGGAFCNGELQEMSMLYLDHVEEDGEQLWSDYGFQLASSSPEPTHWVSTDILPNPPSDGSEE